MKGDKHRQYGNDNEHQYRLNVHPHAPRWMQASCEGLSETGRQAAVPSPSRQWQFGHGDAAVRTPSYGK